MTAESGTGRKSLAELLEPLVGMRCGNAEIGLGQSLRLTFPVSPPEPDAKPWEVHSQASAWRILKSGIVVVGQYDCVDFERGIEALLSELHGRKLVSIELSDSFADIAFVFDRELVVDLRCISAEDEAWNVFIPPDRWIDVGPGKMWQNLSDDEPEFSAAEKAFSEFSEKVGQRWRDRLGRDVGGERRQRPVADAHKKKCGNCAYWRMVTGGFHFWDFGVCSNSRSKIDGQLTGKKSSCEFYDEKIGPQI